MKMRIEARNRMDLAEGGIELTDKAFSCSAGK